MKFSWIDLWVSNIGFIYYTWAQWKPFVSHTEYWMSNEKFQNFDTKIQIKIHYIRADFRFAPIQWQTLLQSNAVFHWLGTYLESALLCGCSGFAMRRYGLDIIVLWMLCTVWSPKCPDMDFDSLTPWGLEWNSRQLISKLILVIGGWGIFCEIAPRWMSLDLPDDKSTLVQVMVCCCQATSHYLSQCWPRSLSPYGINRP